MTYQCPACHQASLGEEGDGLQCPHCGRCFPMVNSTPVLINDDNSVFAIEDYLGAGAGPSIVIAPASGVRGIVRRLARGLTESRIVPPPFKISDVFAQVSHDVDGRPRVLILGAGDVRYDWPADFVYTDVAFSPGLDTIADGHDLPFDKDEFDLVVAISMLEHVANPARVVDEIWRVLKPRGCVLACTPFLFPVHLGAYDFTRFTYLGHRRLFRRFADLASGMDLGPGTVLANSIQSLLLSLASGRNYRRIARLFSIVIAPPIQCLDYLTRRNPAAIDGASGVFFFGRKQETAISDREIIGLYRGGFRSHQTERSVALGPQPPT